MTAPAPDNTISVNDLVRQLLDRDYLRATRQVLTAIGADMGGSDGVIQRRLAEMDAEAARLEAAGERLSPDNPILRALTADMDTMLRQASARIDGAAGTVQQAGTDAAGVLTRQLALAGFPQEELARLGIVWNQPDAEAVARLVQYADSAAWAENLARFEGAVLDRVNGVALRGYALGWGPMKVARLIRDVVTTMPGYEANALMRTLQLQSLRDAAVVQRVANADILAYQIRMATLDERTCLSCVALHGTRLPIEARIDDHWTGRCFSITQVRGLPEREVETGLDWWNRQNADVRLRMAGPAKFNALEAGAVTLNDFVHVVDDSIFGEMVTEASLKGVLGDAAQQYYQRNQR